MSETNQNTNAQLKEIKEDLLQCDHNTSVQLAKAKNISLDLCEWGCDECLISVVDDSGTWYTLPARLVPAIVKMLRDVG